MIPDPWTTPEIDKDEDVDQEPVDNDDVTPYDFVIAILLRVFSLTPIIAEHVTYLAHTKGMALVTVLPQSEAERRIGKAHFAARLEGFPLTFSLEPEE